MSGGISALSSMVDEMNRAIAMDEHQQYREAASTYQRTLTQLSDMITTREDELKRMRDFQTQHSGRLTVLLKHAGNSAPPPPLKLPPSPSTQQRTNNGEQIVVGQYDTNSKMQSLPISDKHHHHGKRKTQRHRVPKISSTDVSSSQQTSSSSSSATSASNNSDAQAEDDRLTELIKSDIIQPKTEFEWKSIQGMDSIKTDLYQAVVVPIQYPEKFVGLCAPPKGIVLYGPPGNGKSMIAKALAVEAKATFFSISASTIGSKWHGESEKLVKKIFAMATQLAPSIIFLDEMEALLRTRSSREDDVTRKVKTEFLIRMDEIQAKTRVMVIGATNLPGELDDAFKRRFTSSILVPAPSYEARLAIFKTIINNHKHKHTLQDKDFITLAQMTEGYCTSDIEALCRQAAKEPIMQQLASGEMLDKPLTLEMSHFNHVKSKIKPTLTCEELAKYENWRQRH